MPGDGRGQVGPLRSDGRRHAVGRVLVVDGPGGRFVAEHAAVPGSDGLRHAHEGGRQGAADRSPRPAEREIGLSHRQGAERAAGVQLQQEGRVRERMRRAQRTVQPALVGFDLKLDSVGGLSRGCRGGDQGEQQADEQRHA